MVCKYYVISFFSAYNLYLPYVLKKKNIEIQSLFYILIKFTSVNYM